MFTDETILDVAGALLIAIAVVAALLGFQAGEPPLEVIKTVQPVFFLGVAAVAGVAAILAYLKNR